jgi:hypothetical protein
MTNRLRPFSKNSRTGFSASRSTWLRLLFFRCDRSHVSDRTASKDCSSLSAALRGDRGVASCHSQFPGFREGTRQADLQGSALLFHGRSRSGFRDLVSPAFCCDCCVPRVPDEELDQEGRRPIPWRITGIHILFLCWTIANAYYPVLVILGLLFFLAFVSATRLNRQAIALRPPLLVGFFLSALIIHGGCQQWWIAPVLGSLSKWPLMIGATILTAFNDNAAVTYLASLVPGFSDALK